PSGCSGLSSRGVPRRRMILERGGPASRPTGGTMLRMPAGVDLGSSSVKSVVVRAGGRPGPAARRRIATRRRPGGRVEHDAEEILHAAVAALDRKSTRLNSSHDQISYAVFCLKKKKK